MSDRERLYYLDNLKVLLIFLVIVHHVGQAYGSTGGTWPYSYPGERVSSLGLFFLFNASFFMGLFFFISGYFFPASLDRHGPSRFIADRLIRFGVPVLFAGFAMAPVIEYVKYLHYTGGIGFGDFYVYRWLGLSPDPGAARLFNIAHLWFVEHLLVYAVLYGMIGAMVRRRAGARPVSAPRDVPVYSILLYVALLGLVSHIMRTSWGFPTNRWILFLGFIQVEPAHMPQYLSLFILGVFSYRWSLMESLAKARNIYWLIPGLGIYLITIAQLYHGGRGPALFLWEYREALICAGVSLGLLALFRAYLNRQSHIVRILSENAYGAYIIHVPVVVALQYLGDPVHAGPFTLFVIVSLISIPASFLASFLLRLIPGIKRVL